MRSLLSKAVDLWSTLAALFRLLFQKGPPSLPAVPGAVGPMAPVHRAPAMQVTNYMGYAMVPSGLPPIGRVVSPDPVSYSPGEGESVISSSVPVGYGMSIKFRVWAEATNNASGTHVNGMVSVSLHNALGIEEMLSQVSSSSPNSPVTSVPWLASIVEQKMRFSGIDIPAIDEVALEVASAKAYRDSLLHCVQAFASFYVHRVDREDAQNAWKTAEIRYVMNQ